MPTRADDFPHVTARHAAPFAARAQRAAPPAAAACAAAAASAAAVASASASAASVALRPSKASAVSGGGGTSSRTTYSPVLVSWWSSRPRPSDASASVHRQSSS